MEYGGHTEHNATIPQNECAKKTHDHNMWPDLPQNSKWVAEDSDGCADEEKESVCWEQQLDLWDTSD